MRSLLLHLLSFETQAKSVAEKTYLFRELYIETIIRNPNKVGLFGYRKIPGRILHSDAKGRLGVPLRGCVPNNFTAFVLSEAVGTPSDLDAMPAAPETNPKNAKSPRKKSPINPFINTLKTYKRPLKPPKETPKSSARPGSLDRGPWAFEAESQNFCDAF